MESSNKTLIDFVSQKINNSKLAFKKVIFIKSKHRIDNVGCKTTCNEHRTSLSLIDKTDFEIDNDNLTFQGINYDDHLSFIFRLEITRSSLSETF